MAKKTVAKKKAKQLPLVPKEKKVRSVKKPSVKFVSFGFGATIPTQAFGNVTPRIEVQADSYEEARDFAIPRIEELYKHFAEVKPHFMGKITETVKVVVPAIAGAEIKKDQLVKEAPAATPQPTTPAQPAAVDTPAPAATASAQVKSDAVLKAEKAISLAVSEDAMLTIQGQIENSKKLMDFEKPPLLALCLKKRGELAK